ncbi:hypothetical protein C900_02513 [Fulvivirga imtechensis AK7]|uniref:DUF4856 domain-containing protein n=1 Tax=Fulvivirga imtechensis AK7 TaxID=1237149 RepID=L8JTM8_9BACT|nr:DUF4856 domain-containing protein [Fulvivirga imtechensis]ELR71598.1 hypothetical protein C900_02513 [Fulvivirga imtechensis AK7]
MKYKLLLSLLIVGTLFSCGDDDDAQPTLEVPQTYEFTRDGQSTVNFQGQTDRLNMVSEMKAYLSTGDAGETLELQKLLNMYSNENSPFEDPALNASTKQLKDKTFETEKKTFEELFDAAAIASTKGDAAAGVAGRIARGSGKTILVNEKGQEFTQLIEKGLMGAVFYSQIYNSYLSDAKTGDDVDNTNLESGKNYTKMEHHWDEAFGYWGVPTDFPNGNPVLPDEYKRFWANYTNGRDALLGTNKTLMDAYLTGRAAIVAKRYDIKNEQKEIIYEAHELVAAGTAVHYINEALDYFGQNQGDFLHVLSEAYAFVKALEYSPVRKITEEQLSQIKNSDFGTEGDFWTATVAGLQNAKTTLVSVYPELEPVKDEL